MRVRIATTALAIALQLCACGGGDPANPDGSSDGGSGTSSGGAGTGGSDPGPTTPLIDGFDIDAREGGWWQFHYQYVWDGASLEQHDTTFLLVLGAPQQVNGDQWFPVHVEILESDGSDASNPTFEWQMLSFSGYRIRGINGGAPEPLFDAITGKWPGSNEGLFADLNPGGLRQASRDGADWRVAKGSLDSGCEYVEGYGEICDGSASSYTGWDLFRPEIGPAGSYRQGCSGGCLTYSYDLLDASPDGSRPEPVGCPVGEGLYCGGNGVGGDPNTLYNCSQGELTVAEICTTTCVKAPAGTPDHCASSSGCDTGVHGSPSGTPAEYDVCNACYQCATASACADEAASFYGDPVYQGYLDCITPCTTQTCFDNCADLYPVAAGEYSALWSCAVCAECPVNCDAASSCF
ncbi:MAG: hypothetical protein U0271_10545 [Polyangiaceae bacterium]